MLKAVLVISHSGEDPGEMYISFCNIFRCCSCWPLFVAFSLGKFQLMILDPQSVSSHQLPISVRCGGDPADDNNYTRCWVP